MKIKHSLSSPPAKYGGTFFVKKNSHGGTNFFEQIGGEMFQIVTNDQIMQGGGNLTLQIGD